MKNFSIKELELFSGIKAHTLRIWEQRHNILNPQRRKGNLRYYSLADVRKVLNLAMLNKNGYKISFLSGLSPSQVEEKLSGLITDEGKQQIAIKRLFVIFRLPRRCVFSVGRVVEVQFDFTMHFSAKLSCLFLVLFPCLEYLLLRHAKVDVVWVSGATV